MIGNYKNFGIIFIKNDKYFAYLGTAVAFCNGFGRLAFGFLLDKVNIKVLLMSI
jgi:hypothetical protein